MKHLKLRNAEKYQLPQGFIHIVESTKESSMGYLELEPRQEMERVQYPVSQEIIQLTGESDVVIFKDGEEPEEIVLHPGDYLRLPPHTFYIHDNPNDEESLSLWKFDGDVSHFIHEVKEKYSKISE